MYLSALVLGFMYSSYVMNTRVRVCDKVCVCVIVRVCASGVRAPYTNASALVLISFTRPV